MLMPGAGAPVSAVLLRASNRPTPGSHSLIAAAGPRGPPRFVEGEIAETTEGSYAKTANRSVVGFMNEFSFLANVHRSHQRIDDLVTLSNRLSQTPCGPL